MAKMNRERAVKEKRARKQEKKEERKAAAAAGNGEAAENPFPEDSVDEETSRPLGPQDTL
ncbi:MAG: hypothetical protein WD805_01585 [Gaiellaceae bacterium]